MQDLRDAVRALKATPLVSAAAVVSLALGIGANTTIFSILNSLLLKPLPVHEPRQLVTLSSDTAEEDVTYAVWTEIREAGVLSHPFAWATDRVEFEEAGQTIWLDAMWVSGGFFDTL